LLIFPFIKRTIILTQAYNDLANWLKNCTTTHFENVIPQKVKLLKKGAFFNPVEPIVIFLLLIHYAICEAIELFRPKWKNFIPTIINHTN
jgi:hypothetical protein